MAQLVGGAEAEAVYAAEFLRDPERWGPRLWGKWQPFQVVDELAAHPDAAVRRVALDLWDWGSLDGYEPLLRDPDAGVRQAALRAVRRGDRDGARQWRREERRRGAVGDPGLPEGARQTRSAKFDQALVQCLEDPDAGVRAEAAVMLALWGVAPAERLLAPLLDAIAVPNRTHATTRHALFEALSRLPPGFHRLATPYVLAAQADRDGGELAGLALLDATAAPPTAAVVDALRHAWPQGRAGAASWLSCLELAPAERLELLLRALDDESPMVGGVAAPQFACLASASDLALPPLRERLRAARRGA
jgi:hypothetical protein